MRLLALITSAFLLLPLTAHAAPEIGKPAPEFTASAVDGATVSPSFYKGKIVVLEWTNPDCPFVHKHYDTENMQKLQRYAADKGVVWIAINSGGKGKEGSLDIQQARDYISSNHVGVTHYILDPTGTIGKLYGAKTTPHMFVIDASGNVTYMGAIDDKPTPDPTAVTTANNYVRAAIDSLLAGKPVAVASTQSYGCSVKYGD